MFPGAAIHQGKVNVVLEEMKKQVHSAQQTSVIASLATVLGKSHLQVGRYLEATAEICCRAQHDMLDSLLSYVKSMRPYITPLCFVHHQTLDETPLRVRVAFDARDAPGGNSQLSKIYVTESQWSMTLKVAHMDHTKGSEDEDMVARYLFIYGAWSPCVVASDRSTATAIAGVINHAPRPPLSVDDLFPSRLKLLERDEAPANIKADRLHGNTLKDWTAMVWHCTSHKCHTVAEKTLALAKPTLSGVVNTLLAMQSSQQLEQLQKALKSVVQSSLVIVPFRDLPPDAVRYRHNILKQFAPDHSTPKKRATVALLCSLLNSDWRKKAVEHACAGEECCQDLADTAEKICVALVSFLKACKPSKLCKDNWLQWRRPIGIVGLLCHIHRLLPQAFAIAFPTRKKQDS